MSIFGGRHRSLVKFYVGSLTLYRAVITHIFRGHNFYEGAANSLSSSNTLCTSLHADCQNVGGEKGILAVLREPRVSALRHRSIRMEKTGACGQPEPKAEGICGRSVYLPASASNKNY